MRLLSLVIYLIGYSTYAQSLKADTSFLAAAKKNAVAAYKSQIEGQSHLLNGRSYSLYKPQYHGRSYYDHEHPYFSFQWQEGKVSYGGEWYDLLFLYDLNTDKLIAEDSHGQFQLVNEKVGGLLFNGHNFLLVKEDQVPHGFYEVPYKSHSMVLIRWEKTKKVIVENQKITNEFHLKKSYYIKKAGVCYSVKSKRSVLKVFSEQKAELRKFVRSQDTPYSSDRGFFIKKMAQLYDQLQAVK